MQTNNFLRIGGVNFATWPGVIMEASMMNTSPATPVSSSFSLISPIMSTSLMPFHTLNFISVSSTWARITVTRSPLEVRPGKGGMCLQIQGPEERHYSHVREQNESSSGFEQLWLLQVSSNNARLSQLCWGGIFFDDSNLQGKPHVTEQHTMTGTAEEQKYSSCSFFISALDRSGWPTSCTGHFILWEVPPYSL